MQQCDGQGDQEQDCGLERYAAWRDRTSEDHGLVAGEILSKAKEAQAESPEEQRRAPDQHASFMERRAP
jgi:hypothetical protein